MRDTQRGSQSYKEKRRGRREIEVTRRRRGGVIKGESNLASNHFPMFSPQPGTPRESHRVTKRRKEGGRGDQEDKRGQSKGERSIWPVISSLCSPYPGSPREIHRVGVRR